MSDRLCKWAVVVCALVTWTWALACVWTISSAKYLAHDYYPPLGWHAILPFTIFAVFVMYLERLLVSREESVFSNTVELGKPKPVTPSPCGNCGRYVREVALHTCL